MITFDNSTPDDIPQIAEWASLDPYHFHQAQPEWWLGQDGAALAFCLTDEQGPLTYVRLDAEGEYIRIHTQFAPLTEVSRRRLVVGMNQAMKTLIEYYKKIEKKGMIYNTINPSLAAFMDKYHGFKPVGQDDYRLDFEG